MNGCGTGAWVFEQQSGSAGHSRASTSMDEVPGARPIPVPMTAVLIEGVDVIHSAEGLIGAWAGLHR